MVWGGLVGGAGALLLLTAGCSDESGGGNPLGDAQVSECTGGGDSSQRIRVRVTNSGSGTADYLVAVAQLDEDSGTRIGTTTILVRAVRPGETSGHYGFSETFFKPWTCEIADVQRTGVGSLRVWLTVVTRSFTR